MKWMLIEYQNTNAIINQRGIEIDPGIFDEIVSKLIFRNSWKIPKEKANAFIRLLGQARIIVIITKDTRTFNRLS